MAKGLGGTDIEWLLGSCDTAAHAGAEVVSRDRAERVQGLRPWLVSGVLILGMGPRFMGLRRPMGWDSFMIATRLVLVFF